MAVLSKASVYEQMFGTRHRGRGRPAGDSEPLFGAVADLKAYDPRVVAAAKRRAYAVIAEEQRSRLREVFLTELKVLNRRGAAKDPAGSRAGGRTGVKEKSNG